MRRLDLMGQRFGRLVCLGPSPRPSRNRFWFFRCDCGQETEVRGDAARRGNTQSCGCLAVETATRLLTTHGHSKRAEYQCWVGMVRRCTDPNARSYPRYGGRGVRLCDRWRESFEHFLDDVGPRPSPLHTLDRESAGANYEPGKVVWSTSSKQARNKRNSVVVTWRGRPMPLIEACELEGRDYNTVRQRVRRYGWPLQRALGA